jgi:hypothetical protein
MPKKTRAPEREEDLENPGFWSEFFGFISHNKKWWLIPLIAMLLLMGGLLLVAGQHSALAPFIYTLF